MTAKLKMEKIQKSFLHFLSKNIKEQRWLSAPQHPATKSFPGNSVWWQTDDGAAGTVLGTQRAHSTAHRITGEGLASGVLLTAYKPTPGCAPRLKPRSLLSIQLFFQVSWKLSRISSAERNQNPSRITWGKWSPVTIKTRISAKSKHQELLAVCSISLPHSVCTEKGAEGHCILQRLENGTGVHRSRGTSISVINAIIAEWMQSKRYMVRISHPLYPT